MLCQLIYNIEIIIGKRKFLKIYLNFENLIPYLVIKLKLKNLNHN